MKHIQLILVSLLLIGSVYSNSSRDIHAKENKYKEDLKVKHSLFREKDDLDRMSKEYVGIPEYKDK